jgi:hypothetical protein
VNSYTIHVPIYIIKTPTEFSIEACYEAILRMHGTNRGNGEGSKAYHMGSVQGLSPDELKPAALRASDVTRKWKFARQNKDQSVSRFVAFMDGWKDKWNLLLTHRDAISCFTVYDLRSVMHWLNGW